MDDCTLFVTKIDSCLSWFRSAISYISYSFIVPVTLCSELWKLLSRNIPGLIHSKNIRDVRMNVSRLYDVKYFYDFKNMELF